MNLYHFTIERYVPLIREHGILPMAEKRRRDMYPPGFNPPPPQFEMEDELVWLTRHPEAYAGVADPGVDEPARIEVAVDNARAWRTAHPRYRVPPIWLEALRRAAAGMGANNYDRDWYVVEGIVPASAIVDVVVYTDPLARSKS